MVSRRLAIRSPTLYRPVEQELATIRSAHHSNPQIPPSLGLGRERNLQAIMRISIV
jgi:hypothetical protein